MDNENFEEFDLEEAFEEEFQKREEKPIFRIFKWVVAFLVVIGLFNLFGFGNFFLYRTTSPDVKQIEVLKKIDAEILEVPLNILVLTSEGGNFGSNRSKESVLSLVENADEIWEQAGIDLVTKSIHFEELPDEVLRTLYQNPMLVINNVKNFDESVINVFLVGSIGGINGVSFNNLKAVAVADYTTVYDFRALAHEIGHQLGLSHVSKLSGELMYQGANGFNLSIEEIEIAREKTSTYFNKN
jgi:hypothetical protein